MLHLILGGNTRLEKIVIISTRLGGINGVSIEAGKWAKAYIALNLKQFFIARKFGKVDKRNSYKIEEKIYL